MKTHWGKELPIYLGLVIVTVFFCWVFVARFGVFGADVDWISQHSVIPDYFRQQFYETGELFSQFALNLGGGQNIYHFAYYGLYSPVLLISYLLPQMKMGDYLMLSAVICLAVSVCLFFYWLGKRGISKMNRILTSLLFLLAAPMIYQFYVQVMFVNYMPFLLLAIIGVDRYFEEDPAARCGYRRKKVLYTTGVFLMIMSSFYFSIGGMLALVLYGLYRYAETKEYPGAAGDWNSRNRLQKIRKFFADGAAFVFPILTAVLMSGILLVPTAFALMGRGTGEELSEAEMLSLFFPEISLTKILYSSYGLGLTTLAVTVLITGLLYRKNKEKILSYGCLILLAFPVFTWLLNGGLYVRDKAVIPFLPLVCYLIAMYLEKMRIKEISMPAAGSAYVITIAVLLWNREDLENQEWFLLVMAEAVLMLICFFIYWMVQRKKENRAERTRSASWIFAVPAIVCLCVFQSQSHCVDGKILSRGFYDQVTDERTGELITETLQNAQDTGLYRTEQVGDEEENAANLNRIWDMDQYISSIYSSAYNPQYQEFRKDIFGLEEPYRNVLMQGNSPNPLFCKFMGVKYTLQDGTVMVRENTAPILYATDRLISEEDYDALQFPYNQLVFAEYSVADNAGGGEKEWQEELAGLAEPLEIELPENIHETEESSVEIPVEPEEKERVFYLQFQVENLNPNQDVTVWCEGIRNKLSCEDHVYYNGNTTFTYVTELEAGQQSVSLVFGAGEYRISRVCCYVGSSEILDSQELYQSEFQVDREKTKGNRIEGTVNVKETGYLITSIPYEEHFEILIDGKQVPLQKVNKAFVGCEIEEGRHTVEILYHAPGLVAGKVLSVLGLLIFVGVIIYPFCCHWKKVHN